MSTMAEDQAEQTAYNAVSKGQKQSDCEDHHKSNGGKA